MIPQNPIWSSLTDTKPYPTYGILPAIPSGVAVYAISPGPETLSNSQGKLNTKYWICYQLSGFIVVSYETGGAWSAPQNIVAVADEIADIGLTFDQLGQVVIIYKLTTSSMLKLYWFDSVIPGFTTSDIVNGSSPRACTDYLSNTSNPNSDAMIFYVDSTDTLRYRIQRDRYTVEYSPGISFPGLKLDTVGIRTDNRLQVLYKYLS